MQKKVIKNYIHVMKYMGSKRELLEQIEKIINKNLSVGQTILDIFAGTCSVGIYLRDKYPIYSNDIQLYSQIISQGTIEVKPQKISQEKIWSLLERNYTKNYYYLANKLTSYLKQSQKFLEVKNWNKQTLSSYLEFIQTVPSPLNDQNIKQESGKWLIKEYFKRQNHHQAFPYLQTTALFSEMYFSMEQALVIDSLKYAIDNLAEHPDLAAILNVALIHSYSYNSAGTGHFAQFRDLSTVSSVKDVFLYRNRSVLDYFFRKAEEILKATELNNYYKQSKSFAKDFQDLISDQKIMKRVSLIYADPPYSFVHYSRFYHAIEDLCRYDYPSVEHKGRYRTDRHQSPFCIKTQAPTAFKTLLGGGYNYQIPVLVSYSNTGMIKLSLIEQIAKEIGYKTELLEIAHKHSTMGRLKDKDRDVTEALLLCY